MMLQRRLSKSAAELFGLGKKSLHFCSQPLGYFGEAFSAAPLWMYLAVLTILLLFSDVAAGQQPQRTLRELKSRAQRASRENRLDEAARLYRQALRLSPRWADGWWSLGTLEYDRDHYLQSASAFQQVLTLQPSNGTAHAMLGLCQFELGSDNLALKNLLAAEHYGIINNDELRKVAVYHLGVLQLRARRFGDAQETLRQLAKQKVWTKELILALGQAALLIRSLEPPKENGDTAAVVERTGEAEALSATNQFDHAKEIYITLTSQYPDYPNLHFAYGRMLLETGATEPAIEELKRELQRDPKNVNSMLEIASVRYQEDSLDGLKYAEEAVKLAPQIPFGHYMLGALRLDTGDAAGAVPELEIAQKAFPDVANVYYALGNAYSRVGRKAEAAQARAKFLRLNSLKQAQDPQYELDAYRKRALSEAHSESPDRAKKPQ